MRVQGHAILSAHGETQHGPLIWLAVFVFTALVVIVAYRIWENVACKVVLDFLGRSSDERLPLAQRVNAQDLLPLQSHMQVISDLLCDINDIFLSAVDEREPLTYSQLKRFIASKEANVGRFGIGSTDRLAALLGNGPEAAVAFFAFSAQCSFAPLDPAMQQAELDFMLASLQAKAVATMTEDNADKITSCLILKLISNPSTTGLFTISAIPEALKNSIDGVDPPWVAHDNIALLLFTSGTTKKPKLVPLTHQNLIIAALCIRDTMQLWKGDMCMGMMPLFHIGGLSSNILATAAASARVLCAPHFSGPSALEWMQKCYPSWYYASPTIHVLIMGQNHGLPCPSLRFIRNASAALLPSVAFEMQKKFACLVIPTYGMTEAMPVCSHNRSCAIRLASCGPAAGPEVSLSKDGEVRIRGAPVFSGYEVREPHEENPNPCAFREGWFHTGDVGTMDSDGYLYLSGRNKEIIIRGGEKISPLEVEDSLLHPSVTEKIAFVVPHEELGEVVGLAVQTSVPDDELLNLKTSMIQTSSLSYKWVPQVIVKMEKLPRGNTGKLLRIGFAKRVGLPTMSIHAAQQSIAFVYRDGSLVAVDKEQGKEQHPDNVLTQPDSLGVLRTVSRGQRQSMLIISRMYPCMAFLVVWEHYTGTHSRIHNFPLLAMHHPTLHSIIGTISHSCDPVSCCILLMGFSLGLHSEYNFGRRDVLIAGLILSFYLLNCGCFAAFYSVATGCDYHTLQSDIEKGTTSKHPLTTIWFFWAFLLFRVMQVSAHYLSIHPALHVSLSATLCLLTPPLLKLCPPVKEYQWWEPSLWQCSPQNLLYLYTLLLLAMYCGPLVVRSIQNGSVRLIKSSFGRLSLWLLAVVMLVVQTVITAEISSKLGMKSARNAYECTLFFQGKDDNGFGESTCHAIHGCYALHWVAMLTVVITLTPGLWLLESLGPYAVGSYIMHRSVMPIVVSHGVVIYGLLIVPPLNNLVTSDWWVSQPLLLLIATFFYILGACMISGVCFVWFAWGFVGLMMCIFRSLGLIR